TTAPSIAASASQRAGNPPPRLAAPDKRNRHPSGWWFFCWKMYKSGKKQVIHRGNVLSIRKNPSNDCCAQSYPHYPQPCMYTGNMLWVKDIGGMGRGMD
ncbi:MAG: hypothetical protein RR482_02975, partial [Clostridia bacterium]